jgi:hypothetical protein
VKLTAEGAAARGIWNRALAHDSDATISQTSTWMDCLCASGRWRDVTRAYLADDGRELILPLAGWRRSAGATPVAASMPFGWGTGGLLCLDGRLSAADVAAVVRDLSRERPVRTTLRPGPAMEQAWVAGVPEHVKRTRHMSQSIELADGFSAVSSRFSASVRRNVRKAERGPITVEWGEGARLVPAFDALYRTSVARWAERQHEPRTLAQWRARRRDPPSKFQLVAERLGTACRIGVAWRSGAPAAAIIVLTHGVHSSYWRGAMDQALAAGTGANELLHCKAIEDACQTGRRWYHLGDSAPGSSLAEFKRRLGAEEEHYTGYRLEHWPLTGAEELARTAVKRMLRFRD